ncbi:E3 ubiquitin-protein ligase rnf8 isoform X1 [Lepisosteus oculatus]|uniref:E3 ubiquitin-protein ligase rnf8 isoform X1 n=1 Tax=Lepisosteus oculatus TaxID=7918 RepID=UPI0035F52F03
MAEEAESGAVSGEEDDAAKDEIWCLRRVGKRAEWLRLPEKEEVTLGRSFDVTYQTLSRSCPLMISRNHCKFKQNEEGHWTVTDNKSLNGVWVNGLRITPERTHTLHVGDTIQLGVPLGGKEVEFEYVLVRDCLKSVKPFLLKEPVEEEAAGSRLKRTKRKYSGGELDPGNTSDAKAKLSRWSHAEPQPQGSSCAAVQQPPVQNIQTAEPAGPSRTPPSSPAAAGGSEKPQKNTHCSSELACFQRYIRKMRVLKKKVQETERRAASLQAQPAPPSEELEQLQGRLEVLKEQLHSEQQQQLRRVEQLEKTFCEEERRLEDEKKQQEEESLNKKLDDALQKHRQVIEELRRSRKDFEEIIQAKDKELEETKEAKEKARAQKEEVLTQMAEVLENELQCIICSEYFIEAVTLNCAHSFCLHCIMDWRRRKDECPICRQGVVSLTRSLVLDNCIDRMVENLSSEMKERRKSLVCQRKAQRVPVVLISDGDSSEVSVDRSISPLMSLDETSRSVSTYSLSTSTFVTTQTAERSEIKTAQSY